MRKMMMLDSMGTTDLVVKVAERQNPDRSPTLVPWMAVVTLGPDYLIGTSARGTDAGHACTNLRQYLTRVFPDCKFTYSDEG